jgi:hypothetical protein
MINELPLEFLKDIIFLVCICITTYKGLIAGANKIAEIDNKVFIDALEKVLANQKLHTQHENTYRDHEKRITTIEVKFEKFDDKLDNISLRIDEIFKLMK